MIEAKETPIIEKRIIHHAKGKQEGPILVFFAGIHGNEQAGVEALKNVLPALKEKDIYGDVYGIYGNIKALKQNKRYIDADLNRIWTSQNIKNLSSSYDVVHEEKEQKSIYTFISKLLLKNKRPIYFIDFHTTSSKTLPFITINDALINRGFSRHFPVPIVLGIEEYLEGPLLSYLNKSGYVSLGFEAGQHNDKQAIKNCESFIHIACHISGVYLEEDRSFEHHFNCLKKASKNNTDIYEVVYKYHISENETFKMKPGFKSFQPIKKGTLLATSNNLPVYSDYNYDLFMPLYQDKGNDGFFIIRRIPKLFLNLSTTLRLLKADNLLTFLPGINWHDKSNGILKANLKITRFLVKPVFHLLGYRNKHEDKTHLLLYNRERVSKKKMYNNLPWYKA